MEAVERLRASLVAAGVSVPEHGYAESVLSGLERELAPLRLPAALRELYARVTVGSLALGPGMDVASPFTPWFADVAWSWWLWRAIRDRPGLMPEALLPVVWYGGVMQLVELAGDGAAGGRVFEWRRGAGELELCYPTVGVWLDAMAALVADPSARRLTLSGDARWLVVSHERERERRGEGPRIATDNPATWPERWRAFGHRGRRRHTELSVSEFLWAPPDSATVSGMLRFGTREPARLQLADGTGWLDVWCPAELPGLWLTEREIAVEFDVTPYAGAWPGDDSPPQATATALRLRTFG